MKISHKLELRQGQQLVMTPQLQQAIRLLQMSNLELSTFVGEEIVRNPVLQRDEEGGEAQSQPTPDQPASQPVDRAMSEQGPGAAETPFDTGSENLYEARPAPTPTAGRDSQAGLSGPGAGGAPVNLEEILSNEANLLDHLDGQLPLLSTDPVTLAIARALAADLDEAGYLTTPLEDAAARLGVDIAMVEDALAVLQRCDPIGVGARSLAECLALQAKDRNRLDPAMSALLDNLPLLARADFPRLRDLCGVDDEDLRDMAREVRALNPRPASAFAGAPAVTAPPDVFVRPHPFAGWTVELNTDTLPKVLVNNAYMAELGAGADDEAKLFISECRQNASWLISALQQRARTILRVATEIVRRQDEFFTYGVRALKPMTLKVIAEELGMHESTVSRVTSGKYLATERGMFELKYFFRQSIPRADGGEAVSSASVQQQIRVLIEAENPKKTLSDDKIVTKLRELGVDIARRTVAKYREAMNIPSSVQRKRLKMAGLSDR